MPVGEYLFSSLKSNNAIMLDKTKRFRKTLGYGNRTLSKFDFPETNPVDLRIIRERRQQERRQLFTKRLILFSMILIPLILMVFR